jgi:hypothetical protein
MDKYQQIILTRNTWFYFKETESSPDGRDLEPWPADSILIKQNPDYHITRYCLSAIFVTPLSVFVKKKGEWTEVPSFMDHALPHADTFAYRANIAIDFDDRVEQIKFVFQNGIADDFIADVHYQEADKEAFDEKKQQEDTEALIRSMGVRVTTGESLINVMFSEASSDVAKTIVTLYMRDNQDNRSLMGTFPVEQGMLFKSISGLAFGRYSIKVAQVDAKDQFIAASDYVDVELRQPNYGGKPVIRP